MSDERKSRYAGLLMELGFQPQDPSAGVSFAVLRRDNAKLDTPIFITSCGFISITVVVDEFGQGWRAHESIDMSVYGFGNAMEALLEHIKPKGGTH